VSKFLRACQLYGKYSTPVVPISEIKIGRRHRKDTGDLDGLAKEIAQIGLLHPVVITSDKQLIAGQRRIEAYKLLGRTDIPVRFVDIDNIVRGEYAENAERKDFLPSEIDAIRRTLEPIEKAAAKERQSLAAKGGEIPAGDRGRALDKVGTFAGVDRKTVTKIAYVMDAAEKDPKNVGPLVEEMDRTGKVDPIFKRVQAIKDPSKANGHLPSAWFWDPHDH
jgi:hypothetical protein